jgi:hypothetical protein
LPLPPPLLLLLLCCSPYYINRSTMQQLQAEFPEQYNATSASKFRAADDMQFAAAYKWYAALLAATTQASAKQQQQQQQGVQDIQLHLIEDKADAAAGNVGRDAAVQFVMLQDRMAWEGGCFRQLDEAWRKPGVKFVCLNDNTHDSQHLPEINRQTVQFLEWRYPEPSEFELSGGISNGCRNFEASYAALPSAQGIAAACFSSQLSL